MFYLLYHSNNVLGVFDSLRCVESTISSLVHNKLTKVNNFNVIEYRNNVTSVGTNVNNILKLPFNLNSDSSTSNIVDTNNKSTLINRDIFEQFSDNETTEEYNYDSTEMNISDDNLDNDNQSDNQSNNEDNSVVEETEEQKERRIRREKRKNKIDYNIQILKNRKEKLEEGRRVFEIDKDLYLKFKKIKDENESFEIPPMFTKKYDVLKILEEENSLNFESFDQVYEKDISNTKWSKLFSGNAKERPLLDITESESDNEN